MLSAIISILIAIVVSVKVKANIRFGTFTIVLLIMLPAMAYIVAGVNIVLSGMSGSMVVKDFFSIAGQCYSEPFRMFTTPAEGSPSINTSLALAGTLVLISTSVVVGQFIAYVARQRDNQMEAAVVSH